MTSVDIAKLEEMLSVIRDFRYGLEDAGVFIDFSKARGIKELFNVKEPKPLYLDFFSTNKLYNRDETFYMYFKPETESDLNDKVEFENTPITKWYRNYKKDILKLVESCTSAIKHEDGEVVYVVKKPNEIKDLSKFLKSYRDKFFRIFIKGLLCADNFYCDFSNPKSVLPDTKGKNYLVIKDIISRL